MKRSLYLAAFLLASLAPAAAGAQSLEAGVKLFEAKRYAEAKAFFSPYAGENAEAAYYLGRITSATNEEHAAAWFEKAMKMDPNSSVYVEWYGRALGDEASRASKFRLPFLARKIKGAFEKAVALDPDNLDAREDLMQYYIRAPGLFGGSTQKAREIALDVRSRNAYRGGFAVASVCIADKDFACGERELLALKQNYPDSAAVYSQLAAYYADRGQFDNSFVVIDERLKTHPGDMGAVFELGRSAALSGENLDDGEKALKSYLASPPAVNSIPPAVVHFRLGMLYEKEGKKDLARAEYNAALQINPRLSDAKRALEALGT